MSKIITVFGATGKQGGSVIRSILEDAQLSKEFKVRAVTRDPTKASAQALGKKGVEVVSADLNSIDSVTKALAGSDTVFLVTNPWEMSDVKLELTQGKTVTDAAKAVGVSHLIFSSLPHVAEATKGRLTHVTHFDNKAEVERYMRASGLNSTFFLPGYYMSNLTQMVQKGEDGTLQLYYPVDGQKAKFPLFDAAKDTGLFVKAIIKHKTELLGKQVLAATDYFTAEEMTDILSKETGKKAVFIQVTPEQWKATLPPTIAQEMLENHLFVEDPGYFLGESLEPGLKLLDSKPTAWADFVKENIASWT